MPVDTLIAPEEELTFEKKPPKISEPSSRPAAKKLGPSVLVEIFAGHEEFLGYTPD
ncbi:MAG: hypothetical protein WA676_03505 [Candidatus Sulfotelmatobacter sp.]